jgi:DNA gyrase/topoisomerase IV subunit A
MTKTKTIRLPISKFIDQKFREYSLYVLTARGIPSFYDALTPVQRYILMNSPQSFTKTLSVVGDSMKDGYHHGDMSLGKAISKLARPFGSSLQILEGYGFFGSEVCPEPAAARYTSIKLAKETSEILKKYKHLTTREPDGPYHPFWLDAPLGLTTSIVGIAVGYKTTILPRKLSDIKEYLEGKRDKVPPHFHDFKGTIHKHRGLERAWIISSKVTVNDKRMEIRELPPILNYTTVIKKLDYLFNRYEGLIKILNNSNKKVNIDIIYTGKGDQEWKEIQEYIEKAFSIIVTESPVFIKDGKVLVYDSIEQYLDDYKWQVKRLLWKNTEYERDWLSSELLFNQAKEQFINFVLIKKRAVSELDEFLKPYASELKSRLEGLTAKKFTKDELVSTKEKIKELEKNLKTKDKDLIKTKIDFEKMKDPTLERGVSSKRTAIDLFDTEDFEEINGIMVWDGEDPFDKEENIEDDDE